ncbi:unnamed protein product [Caenorhabditis auriculariae]|uniref:Uncharacterized protein n=1 Tax=Caenorhabditis auriculariae TaxID=2777116 RepID=A0A8S1HRA2_9PELO|nr:unnamed protein product [Caenorhabditis auriculariae]
MEKNAWLGVVCAFTSTVTFGSTYVPLKWFDKADGIFFQWLMSAGQLMVGCLVAVTSPPTPLHPLAMLKLFDCFFIMNGVGMSIGYLLWNTITCICGWAVSRFGLFGNPQQFVQSDFLNILGVVGVCLGGAIYAPIKHVPPKVRPAPWTVKIAEEEQSHHVPTSRRILCLLLTIFVGFLYGNFLTPINYIIAREEGAPPDVRCYFQSYCMGSFITSTLIFAVYASFKKNRPLVNAELCLPSMAAGLLYGIAVITFFMANQHLDQVIAYPILSKAPGIVVSLWGIFLFKEIQQMIRFERRILQNVMPFRPASFTPSSHLLAQGTTFGGQTGARRSLSGLDVNTALELSPDRVYDAELSRRLAGRPAFYDDSLGIIFDGNSAFFLSDRLPLDGRDRSAGRQLGRERSLDRLGRERSLDRLERERLDRERLDRERLERDRLGRDSRGLGRDGRELGRGLTQFERETQQLGQETTYLVLSRELLRGLRLTPRQLATLNLTATEAQALAAPQFALTGEQVAALRLSPAQLFGLRLQPAQIEDIRPYLTQQQLDGLYSLQRQYGGELLREQGLLQGNLQGLQLQGRTRASLSDVNTALEPTIRSAYVIDATR